MSDEKKAGRPLNATDTEIQATGEATKAQIAKLFRRDPKTLDRLLYGLIPSGVRRGTTVYSIEEAAGRLVRPNYSIEAYIRRMHHTDLPPLLAKEFWNGLRARQAYEKEAGDLWPTPEVLAHYAEAANAMRMSLLLMVDSIDRESTLSPRQKEILKRLTDAAINKTKEILVERFESYEPPDAFGSTLPAIGPSSSGSGGVVPHGRPASGYDSLLDAPEDEEDGLGLRVDLGDDLLDL